MDRDLRNIEELFRSALREDEEMPDATVWKAIYNDLNEERVIGLKRKYQDLTGHSTSIFSAFRFNNLRLLKKASKHRYQYFT